MNNYSKVALTMKLKKNWKWQVLRFLIVSVTIVLGGGYAGFAIWARQGLNSKLAEAKKIGMPVVPSDIPYTAPNPNTNAATYYQIASTAFDKDPKIQRSLKLISTSHLARKQPSSAEIGDAMSSLQAIIKPLDLATSLTVYSRAPDFVEMSPNRSLVLMKLTSFTSLYVMIAKNCSDAGDVLGAQTALSKAYRIAGHACKDHLYFGQLVGIACIGSADGGSLYIIQKYGKESRYRKAIYAALAFRPSNLNVKQMFGEEIVYDRGSLRRTQIQQTQATDEDSPPKEPSLSERIKGTPPYRDAYDKQFLDYCLYIWPKLPEDSSQWKTITALFKTVSSRLQGSTNTFDDAAKMMLPVFSRLGDIVGNLQMYERLMRTSLSLLEEKERTGRFPEKLKNSETAIDPFSDDLLKYRLEGSGFELYSVGMDRIDNGGQMRNLFSRDTVVHVQ